MSSLILPVLDFSALITWPLLLINEIVKVNMARAATYIILLALIQSAQSWA